MQSQTLNIEGMTCAASARNIERATKKLSGVEEATVNYTIERLFVKFDEKTVTLEDIRKTVEKAGYKLLLPSQDPDSEHGEKKHLETERILWRFVLSALFSIPLVFIAMVPLLLHLIGLHPPAALDTDLHPVRHSLIQLCLATPVMIIGWRYFYAGFKALANRSPNMDSLIAISSSAAYIYSLVSVIITLRTGIFHAPYFESAATILTLITLGKYIESVSKGKTSEAIKKLVSLSPKTAMVLRNDQEMEVSLDQVAVGDIVIVKPGQKMPVDGDVTEGFTTVDESMITGESIPVEKKPGDKIIGSSLNKTGSIKYVATKVGGDTTLAQIVKLVERAQGSKAPISRLADVISGYFAPAVIGIALIAGLAWFISGQTITFSLTIFISILVIACPCALGLATPIAVMVGMSRGTENGVLIKSGEFLEMAHKIQTVALDKTGTITEGKPIVTDIIATTNDMNEESLLRMAASAEKASEHPLGEAILSYAFNNKISLLKAENFYAIPGYGIEATVDGKNILMGNRQLMRERGVNLKEYELLCDRMSSEGKTLMYVMASGKLRGIIAVADIVKESSRKAIEKLHSMGLEVAMITGDNKRAADAIAKELGIDIVLAEVLPQDKAENVKKLQDGGKKIVAMVGDGINDAPALAQSDVGIAIGTGTDVAIESADIVLMRSELTDVSTAIKLSRETITNIKQNLFWAFGYNVLGILIAAGLLYLIWGGLLLNPMISALAMSLSSASVVMNALRLKNIKLEDE